MTISSKGAETEAILYPAKLIVAAARTAPKAGVRDDINPPALAEAEKDGLTDVMQTIGGVSESTSKNVNDADAIVLIGVNFKRPIDDWMNFNAKLIDLGIAASSAVELAGELNVENGIMGTVGRAAVAMGAMTADEVQGIPISIEGKNLFFDRHPSNKRSEKEPL